MALWWLLACSAEQAPAVQPEAGTTWTEQRRYQVGLARVHEGLELRLLDALGRPVEDAALSVRPAEAFLIDPGECDSVGESRCLHPAGLYLLRLPGGEGPRPELLEVEIDSDAGIDRLIVRSRVP